MPGISYGTKVRLAAGPDVPVEQLRQGDEVIAVCPHRGPFGPVQVVGVHLVGPAPCRKYQFALVNRWDHAAKPTPVAELVCPEDQQVLPDISPGVDVRLLVSTIPMNVWQETTGLLARWLPGGKSPDVSPMSPGGGPHEVHVRLLRHAFVGDYPVFNVRLATDAPAVLLGNGLCVGCQFIHPR